MWSNRFGRGFGPVVWQTTDDDDDDDDGGDDDDDDDDYDDEEMCHWTFNSVKPSGQASFSQWSHRQAVTQKSQECSISSSALHFHPL